MEYIKMTNHFTKTEHKNFPNILITLKYTYRYTMICLEGGDNLSYSIRTFVKCMQYNCTHRQAEFIDYKLITERRTKQQHLLHDF